MQAKIEETKKKLTDINSIITTLDAALKDRALDTLWPLFFSTPSTSSASTGILKSESATTRGAPNAEAFFGALDTKRPSENALAIVAWLYSQYGLYPIVASEVQAVADQVGLTVPTHIYMTLKQAADNGKTLFKKVAGGFELTVTGEKVVKENFSVKKGTLPRPQEDAK